MTDERSYLRENAAQRQRLGALVRRLSDEDLGRPLEGGWTVATLLAHLAFWDRRQLLLLQRWEREGVGPSPVDVDAVNEAVRALSAAIPPRAAAQLAVEAAEAVDRELEQLPPDLVAAIEAAGTVRALRRSMHRREHLDQIERALGTRPTE